MSSTTDNSNANTESGFFQVTFSDQSMSVLNKLETLKQMQVIEQLSGLSSKALEAPKGALGRFNRNGKTLYRLRVEDFRMYFEIQGNTLYCNYILQPHTWADFAFRSKLPVNEDQLVEQEQSFWQYLESLGKKDK